MGRLIKLHQKKVLNYLLLLILVLNFISANDIFSESLRGFTGILGFEDLSAWKGLTPERKIVKEGKQAGLWANTVKNDRVECKEIPEDLSKYNALSMWIYSAVNNGAQIAVVLDSENFKSPGKDYYQTSITINWKGWKKIIIPFETFLKKRNPVGFNKIDKIKFASSSYSISVGPLKSTRLIFDDLKFIKIDRATILKSYKDAMGFEDISLWYGLTRSKKYVKEGKYSGKWADTVKVARVKTKYIPKDWSDFNALAFWLYSGVNNHAEIELVIDSDNPATKAKDRFRHTIYINWKGWKYIKIKFDEFRADRQPAGWHKIDQLQFASSGYSKYPKPDTVLYFDALSLIKESVDIKVKSRDKKFDKNGDYINKVVISLKNLKDKELDFNLKVGKGSLKKFQFIDNIKKDFHFDKKESKDIVLSFKLSKKYFKNVPRLYHEKVKVVAVSKKNKKELGKVELSLYAPYYRGKKIPSIFLSKEEIGSAKEKYKKYKWAKNVVELFLKTADKYSSVEIPHRGGGFLHGGPTGKYYPIFVKHENLTRAARYYAILYRLLGKKEYLKKSKYILMEYSKLLPKFPVQDKYGNVGKLAMPGGGRWGVQILSDCKLLIFLAYAYDLIRNDMTPQEREKFENNVLRLEADQLMLNNEGRHNHQIWYSVTLAVVGYILGDSEYIDFALNAPETGLLTRIFKDSFTAEGWYYERSTGYQYYVLFALTWFLEASYHAGENYYNLPIVKKIYCAPIKVLSRDFKLSIINDGRGIGPLLASRAWVHIIAYSRYRDPIFWPIVSRVKKDEDLEILLYLPIDKVEDKSKPELSVHSILLPNTQWAVVHADKPIGKDFFFWLNYSPHIASHCHPDRLGLILYAFNDFVMPDPGSVKYRSGYHLKWMKSTIAHNTVCVDMKNQNDYKSVMPYPELNYYIISPKLKGVQATGEKVYDNVVFKRTTLMIDDTYILDRFQCYSSDEHTYDLAYHIKGEPHYLGFKMKKLDENPYSDNPNYGLIEDFSVKKLAGDVRIKYLLGKGNGIYFHSIGEKEKKMKLISGMGAISDLDEHVEKKRIPMIILRKEEKNPVYSTILEPYISEPDIINVSREMQKNKEVVLYKVTRKQSVNDIIFLNDLNKVSGNSFLESDGKVVYIKKSNSKIRYILAYGCSYIKLGTGTIKAKRRSDFYIMPEGNKWFVKNIGKKRISLKIDRVLLKTKGKGKVSVNVKPSGKVWIK